MALNIGDRVRFLNDVGGGIVTKINGNMAYVSDEDGFETPILVRECVIIAPANAEKAKTNEAVIKPQAIEPVVTSKDVTPAAKVEEPIDYETPEGEKLNVVLAFEASDLKRLSQSSFDTYLVNDSNYYLYFSFLTRKESDESWHTRYAGLVEPNYQLLIEELSAADLPEIERIALQLIAFKRNRDFSIKSPVSFESRLDTTKFAKFHCFKDNVYFDNPVIAINIVKDDVAQGATQLIEALKEEIIVTKSEPKSKRITKKTNQNKPLQSNGPLVIDLHIEELLETTAGMSNADILNYQIDKFREVMEENLKFGGKKIIFIHGKGEGILRQAIMKELKYRYKSCEVQDASFREYGYGATQVTIHKPQR